jgi:hypothetical protein
LVWGQAIAKYFPEVMAYIIDYRLTKTKVKTPKQSAPNLRGIGWGFTISSSMSYAKSHKFDVMLNLHANFHLKHRQVYSQG